jgi:hypothetical protein
MSDGQSTGSSDETEREPDTSVLIAYPVPAKIKENHMISFRFADVTDVQALLMIYDLLGNLVFTQTGDFKVWGHQARELEMKPWDLRNSRGRRVATGGYLAVLKITRLRDNSVRYLKTKIAISLE